MKEIVEITFKASSNELSRIRDLVNDTALSFNVDKESIDCIVLAVNEACMNIIQHAYKNKPDEIINLKIFTDQNELITYITDFAPPVDKQKVKSRDLDEIRPGGLGVHLMHKVMDKVTFLEPTGDAGNILELRKKFIRK